MMDFENGEKSEIGSNSNSNQKYTKDDFDKKLRNIKPTLSVHP